MDKHKFYLEEENLAADLQNVEMPFSEYTQDKYISTETDYYTWDYIPDIPLGDKRCALNYIQHPEGPWGDEKPFDWAFKQTKLKYPELFKETNHG